VTVASASLQLRPDRQTRRSPGRRGGNQAFGRCDPYVVGGDGRAPARNSAIRPPETCPFSGDRIVQPEGAIDYFCLNPRCPERVFRSIEFSSPGAQWTSKGWEAQTVKTLIDKGIIRDEADIFYLRPEALLELEGFAEKKVENLLASIEAAKQRPLATATSLESTAWAVIAELWRTFGSIDALASASVEEIDAIEGIGEVLAQSVADSFADPYHREILAKMRRAGVNMQAEAKVAASSALEGRTFVLTGTLPAMTREEAEALIKAHGGKVSDSVSKKTSYVLMGESPGSKADKARQLGVPIIGEDDLRRMVEKT
jgi:DNA ligase (NAD+)